MFSTIFQIVSMKYLPPCHTYIRSLSKWDTLLPKIHECNIELNVKQIAFPPPFEQRFLNTEDTASNNDYSNYWLVSWTQFHNNDVIMSAMASQITSLTIVYSIVYSGADQRKHQSSASLAFERRIHLWPVNSPHKWPVTRKMFPFDDVIMFCGCWGKQGTS